MKSDDDGRGGAAKGHRKKERSPSEAKRNTNYMPRAKKGRGRWEEEDKISLEWKSRRIAKFRFMSTENKIRQALFAMMLLVVTRFFLPMKNSLLIQI